MTAKRICTLLMLLGVALGPASKLHAATLVNAVYFDGVDAYVTIPSDVTAGLSSATIEAWVRWESARNWSRVFDFGDKGNAVVLQNEKRSRNLAFTIFPHGRSKRSIRVRKSIVVGRWTHVAVVCGRRGMKLYVDGIIKGSNDHSGAFFGVSGQSYIGRSNWEGDDLFNGYVAEFRIWSHQKDGYEIREFMHRQLSGDEEGLVGYWRFDAASDSEVKDYSKGGNSARLRGSAWIAEGRGPRLEKLQVEPSIPREVAYQAALRRAYEDSSVSEAERVVLGRLAKSLKIDRARGAEIENMVKPRVLRTKARIEAPRVRVRNPQGRVFKGVLLRKGSRTFKVKCTIGDVAVHLQADKSRTHQSEIPHEEISSIVYSRRTTDRIHWIGIVRSNAVDTTWLKVPDKSINEFRSHLAGHVGVLVKFARNPDGTVAFSPPYDISRSELVRVYFEGRSLDPIEGVWVFENDGFELAIMRNTFGKNTKLDWYSDYDYMGFLVERGRKRAQGTMWLGLKATSSTSLYTGKYMSQYKKDKSARGHGTTVILEDNNMLQILMNTGYRGAQQKHYMMRRYPSALAKAPPRSGASPSSRQVVSTGTGFFISRNILVTNYHVLDSGTSYTVVWKGHTLDAHIAVKDETNDLALLKVDFSKLTAETELPEPLGLSGLSTTDEGSDVYTIGYPLIQDLGNRARISEGIINSLVGFENDPRMVQMSVPIQPGNSGGPLLNDRAEVIGVVTSTANSYFFLKKRNVIPQNVNFAVKSNYLTNLLTLLPGSHKTNERNLSSETALSASEIMSRARDSVVLIQSWN